MRFPSAHGDNLILFGDSGVGLKDIGLDRVGNAVDLFWVGPKTTGKSLPECCGVRGFDRYDWKQIQSVGQASLDPWGGKNGGEGVKN